MEALLRQLDFHGQELRLIDRQLGRIALQREEVKRLMTIPGIDATDALSIVAAVGDFHGFPRPEQLASYLGLNPRSGNRRQPASHGRITKHGRGAVAARGRRCRRRARTDQQPAGRWLGAGLIGSS